MGSEAGMSPRLMMASEKSLAMGLVTRRGVESRGVALVVEVAAGAVVVVVVVVVVVGVVVGLRKAGVTGTWGGRAGYGKVEQQTADKIYISTLM